MVAALLAGRFLQKQIREARAAEANESLAINVGQAGGDLVGTTRDTAGIGLSPALPFTHDTLYGITLPGPGAAVKVRQGGQLRVRKLSMKCAVQL